MVIDLARTSCDLPRTIVERTGDPSANQPRECQREAALTSPIPMIPMTGAEEDDALMLYSIQASTTL